MVSEKAIEADPNLYQPESASKQGAFGSNGSGNPLGCS
jgi:hypothetical protein